MPTPRGLYALKHKPTGKIYIGSSINAPGRWAVWQTRLAFAPQNLPASFPRTGLDDWEFVVLKQYPDTATAGELRDDEHKLIERLQQLQPRLCLNKVASPGRKRRGYWPVTDQKRGEHTGWGVTVSHEGEELSLYELSRVTGVAYNTLYYRYNQGWRGDRLVKPTKRTSPP